MMKVRPGCRVNIQSGGLERFLAELSTKLEHELQSHPKPEAPTLFFWAVFMSELSIT